VPKDTAVRTPLLSALLLCALPWIAAADEKAQARIAVTRDGGTEVVFHVGDEVVARYHVRPEAAKPYLWPLVAPGGVEVTRAWPMRKGTPGETTDHVHQKSAWFCHGDVIPEGVELKSKVKGVEGVDFWAEGKDHGKIVCTAVDEPSQAADHARVTTRNEWRTAEGAKILDETRTISLYPRGDARLFVFDIDLHASVCPVTFGDTKEGSFGIRIDDRMTEKSKGGRLTNAAGDVGEKKIWGQPSPWCDYSGTLDGKAVGLAILDHPSNKPAAHWHSRGYGLMAANPFGRAKSQFPAMKGRTDLVRLDRGDHLRLRYGILVHAGDAASGKVAEHFDFFAGPKP
jgi:hypothetical protein